MNRVGFHVNADAIGDRAYFVNFISKYRPKWLLLMADWDLELTRQIQTVTDGETNVVIRFPDNNENSFWRRGDNFARELIANWGLLKLSKGIQHVHFNLLTEPGFDPSETEQLLNWCCSAMDAGRESDVDLVIGNFAPGSITNLAVGGGVYDNFLRKANQYRDYHLIGIHEYGGPIMWGTNWSPEIFLDADKANWKPTISQLHAELRNSDGSFPGNYNILAGAKLNIRARELGFLPPPVLLTEFGHDRLPDLEKSTAGNIYQILESKYGLPDGYGHMRGQNTYRYFWKGVFPERIFEESLLDQYAWFEEVAPENYKGACLFAWNYNSEWVNEGFNFGDLKKLHQLMIDHKTVGEPIPMANVSSVKVAYQEFNKGFMIWFSDTNSIWVFFDTHIIKKFPNGIYASWPDNLPNQLPAMGFGKVWANVPEVKNGLGSPISLERSYESTVVGGSSITLPDGKPVYLLANETWGYSKDLEPEKLSAEATLLKVRALLDEYFSL